MSPGTKYRKGVCEKVGGRAPSCRADSGAILARHVDEEGKEVKQSPLAKCHLGIFTSNMHLSDSDRGESKYKMQKRPL